MAKTKPRKKSRANSTEKGTQGRAPYRFTHLRKVNIRNVFVHSLKIQ